MTLRTWRGLSATYSPEEDEAMRRLREKGSEAELWFIHSLKATFDARLVRA